MLFCVCCVLVWQSLFIGVVSMRVDNDSNERVKKQQRVCVCARETVGNAEKCQKIFVRTKVYLVVVTTIDSVTPRKRTVFHIYCFTDCDLVRSNVLHSKRMTFLHSRYSNRELEHEQHTFSFFLLHARVSSLNRLQKCFRSLSLPLSRSTPGKNNNNSTRLKLKTCKRNVRNLAA